ncbi:MAG TPA: DUF2723 domain-containing protein, partial [Longimicrobium sp.]|nr:DUF2723 domain-containing protein [Longimicrobium sp.]
MTQAAKTVRPNAAASEVPPAAAAAGPRPPYLWAALAALAVFAFYGLTVAPTTGFWDTSEYIATGHILGIPHPPGNPLFVLLARAWDLLLAPTGLPTAVRINLFSAFMSAGTSFFWFLVVHRVLGWFTPDERVRKTGAAVSVVIAATAFTVWYQSNLNEKVYTVSMFTIAALTWLVFLWREHVEEHRGVRGRWNDDNALVLMAFVLALSVANHMMAILVIPALVVLMVMANPSVLSEWETYVIGGLIVVLYLAIGEPAFIFGVLLARPKFDRSWKLHLAVVGAFVFGLSVHLFLSIRSGIHPIINEAQPTCPSVGSALSSIITFGKTGCADLSASLLREQYQKPPVTERQAPFFYQLLNYFQYFDWQWARSVSGDVGYFGKFRQLFTVLFAALGLYGAYEHYRRDRKSFAYLAVLFLTLSVGLTFYMNFKYGYGQLRTLESLRSLSPE